MIKTKHVKIKHNLYGTIRNDYGAQIFTVTPTHDVLPTVNFPVFN